MKQTKKKPVKSLKRRLHIDGQIWTYEVKGSHARIRDPNGITHVVDQRILTGMSWDELERAYHKGHSYDRRAMTPSKVKEYVINSLINRT